jgi:hypothetical protein
MLMFRKVHYLDNFSPSGFVSLNELCFFELLKESVDITVVVWKHCNLDALRAIFESSFAIGQCP